ncbi:TATA box-binding protein-associated factor RNA polymerase I subunit A [Ciona intestinalis]
MSTSTYRDRNFVDKFSKPLQAVLESTSVELLNSFFFNDTRNQVFDVTKTLDVVFDLQNWEEEIIHTIPTVHARPNTLKVLRSKLLQHKWGDAALLLLGFCKLHWNRRGSNIYNEIKWRVGNDVIFHHPAGCHNAEIHITHKRIMGISFESIDQTHIMIEHVFGLLMEYDFSAAKEQMQNYRMIDRSITNRDRRAQDIKTWTPTCEGYLGLLEYVFWKQLIVEEDKDEHELIISTSFHVSKNTTCEKLAEKAIGYISGLVSEPGVWDIFILKLIEIYMFYESLSEAQEDLCVYSRTHESNPNAHRYLYNFLTSTTSEVTDLKIESLKRLQRIDPASELMLDLHHLLLNQWLEAIKQDPKKNLDEEQENRDVIPALNVLMDMLDYPCWAFDVGIWQVFSKALKLARKCKGSEKTRIVEKLWVESGRNSWWPKFHFSSNDSDLIEDSVKRSKHSVAKFFGVKNRKSHLGKRKRRDSGS